MLTCGYSVVCVQPLPPTPPHCWCRVHLATEVQHLPRSSSVPEHWILPSWLPVPQHLATLVFRGEKGSCSDRHILKFLRDTSRTTTTRLLRRERKLRRHAIRYLSQLVCCYLFCTRYWCTIVSIFSAVMKLNFSLYTHQCNSDFLLDHIACTRCVRCSLLLQMSHAAWSVCLSVCMLVMWMSCANMAEPIEMPFGGWLMWVRGTMYKMGIKIGEMHSQPLAVRSWQCGLLPNYFGRSF